jgi:hypothetical protein
MTREQLHSLQIELKTIQQKIEQYKDEETHLEKSRLLKIVDAELMDALHNLELLIETFQD